MNSCSYGYGDRWLRTSQEITIEIRKCKCHSLGTNHVIMANILFILLFIPHNRCTKELSQLSSVIPRSAMIYPCPYLKTSKAAERGQ